MARPTPTPSLSGYFAAGFAAAGPVVGGDVHIGCAFELRFVQATPGGPKPFFVELTTSAVTNRLNRHVKTSKRSS